MNAIEEAVFLKMVKSTVTTFHEFLNDIDKHEIVLSDEPLMSCLQKISRTIQRITSRWNGFPRNSEPKSEHNVSSSEEKVVKNFSALDLGIPDLEPSMMNSRGMSAKISSKKEKESKDKKASHVNTNAATDHPHFIKKVFRSARQRCDDTSSGSDNDDAADISGRVESSESSHFGEKQKLNSSSVLDYDTNLQDEKIIPISADVYACRICNVTSLSKNNLQSHINGKKHSNNRKIWMNKQLRDSSITRLNTDISSVLKDMDSSLICDKNGQSFIIMGSCSLCKVEFTSEGNLKQHIEGSKHKYKVAQTRNSK